MSERETSEAIHERAAEWVARLDRAGDDPAVAAELDAWLAGDERRRGALFRAQAAWMMLDRASVLRRGAGHENADAIESRILLSRRGLLWGGSAAAASLVAAIAGIEFWPRPVERIDTAVGEIRRVPLADGSLAAVNTQTRLEVRIRPKIRRIGLDQGEAWFEVAKDRSRPFVVEAGDVRVQAVGTAFSVRRTQKGATVQVTEGVVEVWSVDDKSNIRRIAAGARTFISDDTGPVSPVEAGEDIDRSLSWRSGQLIFDGETLGQAAEEFNRYNDVQVRIADPALADERFVGRFRTNEPDAFAHAAATILGARVRAGSDEIVLSRS